MSRNTDQRTAVKKALLDAGRPLSAQEVLDAAQSYVTGLGIATVYRNLKLLVGEDWLVVVSMAGEPSRYEVAGKGHHHHFHCRVCNRVFEVPACASGLENMTPAGFVMDDHEVILYGRCKECA